MSELLTIQALRAQVKEAENAARMAEWRTDALMLRAMVGTALEFTDDCGKAAAVVCDLRGGVDKLEHVLALAESVQGEKFRGVE